MILYCKKCGGEKHVKAGFIKGEQRYLCKDCGCKFVPMRQKGRPEKDKLLAVWLYAHGLSFRTVAKFLKVSPRSIYVWVKEFAKSNYVKPEPQSDAIVVELGRNVALSGVKKTRLWRWEAYCRDTNQLIDWECGGRNNATFSSLYERLKRWNIKIFFSDGWGAYSDIIPPELLIQSKAKTHLIESNNMPQRHWFARFRRKTCVVSRSFEMVELTTMLYAAIHVNKMIDMAI